MTCKAQGTELGWSGTEAGGQRRHLAGKMQNMWVSSRSFSQVVKSLGAVKEFFSWDRQDQSHALTIPRGRVRVSNAFIINLVLELFINAPYLVGCF